LTDTHNISKLLGSAGVEILASVWWTKFARAGKATVVADDAAAIAPRVTGAVEDAAQASKRFLGDGYRTITNKAGDEIFMSKDGLRKMRFDFKNTQGDLPHVHLEVFRNGRWRDAIPGTHRIYPKL